jgi:hypothetical protein
MGLFATLSISDTQHNSIECQVPLCRVSRFIIVMLIVIMPLRMVQNKLDRYIKLGWKGLQETITLAYWIDL